MLAAVPEDVRPELLRQLIILERECGAEAGRPASGEEVRRRFGGLGSWAGRVVDQLLTADQPALTLEVVQGPYAGRSFPLFGHSIFMIGRQQGYDIYLPDDPYLSRAHCMIEVNPPLARIVDLGSKTGVRVNGRPVAQANLRDGDEVRVGKTAFRVRTPAAPGSSTLELEGTPPTLTSSSVPPVLPGYRFEGELGRGAMGVVYKAVREAGGETVAIKTLLPAIPATRVAVQRFRRETSDLPQETWSRS